jgi:hypothetical protein
VPFKRNTDNVPYVTDYNSKPRYTKYLFALSFFFRFLLLGIASFFAEHKISAHDN